MDAKRIAVAAAVGVLAAGGAGGAIAATKAKDDPKKVEDSILSTAAKKLGVTTEQLRDALSSAEDAQLDQAVKDGKLTQAQADAIKKHRAERGTVLGFPGGPPGRHRGFGPGGPGGPRGGGIFGDVAKALGITKAKLFSQLRAGKTLAEIAKANGNSLDDVKAAVTASAKKKLDAAVKAGKITQAQADDMLSHLSEHLDHFGEGPPGGGPGHPGFGPPPDGPPPGASDGAYPEAPEGSTAS
jgi:hypothetical protein